MLEWPKRVWSARLLRASNVSLSPDLCPEPRAYPRLPPLRPAGPDGGMSAGFTCALVQ